MSTPRSKTLSQAPKPAPRPQTKLTASRSPASRSSAPRAAAARTTARPLRSPSAPPKQPSHTAKPAPRRIPSAPPASAPQAQGNWLNRAVQDQVAGVGTYASGWIAALGGRVNQVGEKVGGRINDTTRGWGQGVAGYGNSIKDSVAVGGPRVATGGNPLGLAGRGSAKNQPASRRGWEESSRNQRVSGSGSRASHRN